MFRDRYGLNLLRIPRADVAIGDVYPVKGGQTGFPGKLSSLVSPAPALPAIHAGEAMADVASTGSDTVEAEAGFGFLDSFLTALGAVGIQSNIKGAMSSQGARGIQFRFSGATRDYVDPFDFERQLNRVKIHSKQSLLKPDCKYYVVLGVVRSNQISFSAVGKDSNKASINVETLNFAESHAGIGAEKSASEEVTVSGKQALVFAVQLNELYYNPAASRLEISIPQDPDVRARGSRPTTALHSIVGGPEGDLFLHIENETV
jgi:hypothetical protein